jgi:NADPH:quinone reductase-like Zn-dependent oxidoreductase
MRGMRLYGSADRTQLSVEEIPQPQPGPREILVRICAAGVTTTEVLWYPTTHTKSGETRTGAILSHEFSGVVAAVGEQVAEFRVGQEVYGMNDWFADGALAEYCVAPQFGVARKPGRLTHIEAASVPIGALTAWQGLFDRGKLQSDQRILIHGGAGAVGIFAIQLARLRGAHVFATVSARNCDFVRQLGAEQVIDYATQRFEDVVQDVDLVFDGVGGDTFRRSWNVLKPTGRLITIAASGEAATEERTKQSFFIVEPNQTQLIEIGKLLDTGALKPVVDCVLPLEEASAAYSVSAKPSHGRGKLVVTVTPAQANATA